MVDPGSGTESSRPAQPHPDSTERPAWEADQCQRVAVHKMPGQQMFHEAPGEDALLAARVVELQHLAEGDRRPTASIGPEVNAAEQAGDGSGERKIPTAQRPWNDMTRGRRRGSKAKVDPRKDDSLHDPLNLIGGIER